MSPSDTKCKKKKKAFDKREMKVAQAEAEACIAKATVCEQWRVDSLFFNN